MSINFVADVNDLRTSLLWGQPAFTIIDVRDRSKYNQSRITGAISMPLNDLESRVQYTLHRERQIYIYGENDSQSAQGVRTLQFLGFSAVAELSGGLPAWKSIGGATEGTEA
ncbi:MAG: rhodanese-like domain-containing protein [Dolichospermum sp. DET50]|nr:rhodanese-like domain-containing protein [Dolichospermum sp. DET66]MBS3032651.1 rhodanese-like domain-containing protein [Dolichospermum sp. DET67]MBS3037857.1 rhodanese-like domain-containing protein [Dolichospermum sp. DET50]QSX69788.1 MAG: rhodanese-like domain-containing protein [Dolichospermum sp. DET69]